MSMPELSMAEILIIDDDEELFSLLSVYLKGEGFSCRNAILPSEGLKDLKARNYDVVILDVMLPEMNGFEVLRHIRLDADKGKVPVLMLTARGEEIDRILGLEMGADDYLPKPFSPRELVARLRALLRRSAHQQSEQSQISIQKIEDISINPNNLAITVNGRQHDISVSELRLLEQLIQNPGKVVDRDLLSKKIFGHPAYPMDRSLDMLVSRLRRKLGPRPDGGERIKAARGEGYVYLKSGDAR